MSPVSSNLAFILRAMFVVLLAVQIKVSTPPPITGSQEEPCTHPFQR
jgi:hypothetical protein